MEFLSRCSSLLIVVLNAIMGMMQESKAEKALDALKICLPHMPGYCETARPRSLTPPAGARRHHPSGSRRLLSPADARLLDSSNLKSEESALTGESVPVQKDADAVVEEKAPLGDRSNMVFSGCSITYGTGDCRCHRYRYGHRNGQDCRSAGRCRRWSDPLCRKSWQNWART